MLIVIILHCIVFYVYFVVILVFILYAFLSVHSPFQASPEKIYGKVI